MRFSLTVLVLAAGAAMLWNSAEVDRPNRAAIQAAGESHAPPTTETESVVGPFDPVVASGFVTDVADVAGGARESAAPFALEGLVVDARGTSWPDGDVTVRLTIGEDRLEQAVGADGAFRFELGGPPSSGTIWVRTPASWRWVTPTSYYAVELTSGQREGIEPIGLAIAERRFGTVHGVAVDSETGAPIPSLRFQIHPSGSRQRVDVETDALGRFSTAEPIKGGHVEISGRHGEPWPVSRRQDCLVPEGPYDEPWRIPFGVGPRVELDLRGLVPDDLATLTAWFLRPGDPRALAAALRPVDGGRAWVRTATASFGEDEALSLIVADEAGLVTGVAPIRWRREGLSELVAVTLEATAALEVGLDIEENARGERLGDFSYPTVRVEPAVRDSSDPTEPWRLARRRSLRAGPYVVSTTSRSYVSVTKTVALEAGRKLDLKLRVPLEANTHSVHGTIRTESGEALPRVSLGFALVDQPQRTWKVERFTSVQLCGIGIDVWASTIDKDANRVTFQLDNVPRGELALTSGPACSLQWGTRPNDDLEVEVVVLDEAEGPGYGFRPIEPEAVGRFNPRVRVRSEGRPWRWVPGDGSIVERVDPVEHGIEWEAWTRGGFRSLHGGASDFQAEADGRFFVDLAFEPGWSVLVVARDAKSRPLAGAIVLADGAAVGKTGHDGTLRLTLDARPEHLTLDAWGMRPMYGFPPVSLNFADVRHEIVMTD